MPKKILAGLLALALLVTPTCSRSNECVTSQPCGQACISWDRECLIPPEPPPHELPSAIEGIILASASLAVIAGMTLAVMKGMEP